MPATLAPAVFAVLIPSSAGGTYATFLQPGMLLVCSALSLWVALMYREALRSVFLFLAAFLLLYGLASITPLVHKAAELLGSRFLTSLVVYQVFTYAMLLLACLFILRVIGVSRLSRTGWLVMAVTLALAAVIVTRALPAFTTDVQVNRLAASLFLLIRVFDVMVLLMLVPVLWLYIQNARAKYQESASFSVVVLGIIASLILVYLYELLKGQSIAEIAQFEFHKGSVLDALYIWGYSIMAVGLFAHRKHQEWSLKSLEALLK